MSSIFNFDIMLWISYYIILFYFIMNNIISQTIYPKYFIQIGEIQPNCAPPCGPPSWETRSRHAPRISRFRAESPEEFLVSCSPNGRSGRILRNAWKNDITEHRESMHVTRSRGGRYYPEGGAIPLSPYQWRHVNVDKCKVVMPVSLHFSYMLYGLVLQSKAALYGFRKINLLPYCFSLCVNHPYRCD